MSDDVKMWLVVAAVPVGVVFVVQHMWARDRDKRSWLEAIIELLAESW